MTMQASTLGILEAADFSPKQARALAQAIEGEIKGFDPVTEATLDARNFVTVPILDARLGELKLQMSKLEGEMRLELARFENRLFNKMAAMGLSLAGLSLTAVFFMMLNLKR
jgi:hypothetical protein